MYRIQTSRLLLRTLKTSDFEDIFANMSEEVVRYLPDIPWPYTKQDAKSYIKQSLGQLEVGTAIDFGIVFEDRVIGTVSLAQINRENQKGRVAILINQNYWNRGFMTESMHAIIDFSFSQLHLSEIYTGVIPENIASHSVLIKLGFKNNGMNRNQYLIQGEYYNELIFSLSS